MSKTIAHRAFILAAAGLFAIGMSFMPGCASQQETKTTVTHTYPPPATNMDSAPGYDPSQPDTTTTTTTTSNRPDSVLGATAHAVWTVVALPFRVVGDTLGMIL